MQAPSCAGKAPVVLRDKPIKQRWDSARRTLLQEADPLETHPWVISTCQQLLREAPQKQPSRRSVQGSRARGREGQPVSQDEGAGAPHIVTPMNFLLLEMG